MGLPAALPTPAGPLLRLLLLLLVRPRLVRAPERLIPPRRALPLLPQP